MRYDIFQSSNNLTPTYIRREREKVSEFLAQSIIYIYSLK